MYIVALWDTREGMDCKDPHHSFWVREEDNEFDALSSVLIGVRKPAYVHCYEEREYDEIFAGR